MPNDHASFMATSKAAALGKARLVDSDEAPNRETDPGLGDVQSMITSLS
jgi:hypothetical protein